MRELSEETGFTADELIDLGACYTSPGFSSEVLHLYLARGLHAGRSHLDEDEFLNVEKHGLDELLAKTVIAVLKAARLLSKRP